MGMADEVREAIHAGGNAIPFGRLMGFRPTHIEHGKAVVELEVNASHHNPLGRLHGGALCAIADSAMGIAHASVLKQGESGATVDFHITFLRPVSEGKLTATATMVKSGRTLSMLDCDVVDGSGKLIARASGTFITTRRD